MNAEQIEAKRKAQERVTKPLHPEDLPLFLRESVEVQKPEVKDKQDASGE